MDSGLALNLDLRWGLLVAFAVAVGLVIFKPEGVTYVHALLGAGILLAGTLPGLIFLSGRHPAPIPVFPVAALFYAVCFGSPVFLVDVIWPAGSSVIVYHNARVMDRLEFLDLRALSLVLAGLVGMTGFYYLAAARMLKRLPHFSLPRAYDTRRLAFLFGALLIGHLAYLFIPAVKTLPSIGQLLGPAVFLSFGGFYWLARSKQIPRWSVILIFGVILPIVIVKKLSGGLLTPVILIGLFFFFLMWFFQNRAVLVIAAICGVSVLAAYGPITEFRLNTWTNPELSTYSFSEKLRHAFDYRRAGMSLGEKLTSSGHMVAKRISFIAMLSHVVQETPDEIPYWGGATYKPLLTSVIPRAFWPEKPEERAGHEFGVRYGFIFPYADMSMNMPWIVEMFVNFGVIGVLAGMSLTGVFLAFLDRFFNNPGMPPLEAVVGLTIMFPLAYPDSNFSVMCGSLIPLTICIWLYFRIGLVIVPDIETRIFGKRPA